MCKVVLILAGAGAFNWGLIAFFDLNVVSELIGGGLVARIVYGAIGLAGLAALVSVVKSCPCCDPRVYKGSESSGKS